MSNKISSQIKILFQYFLLLLKFIFGKDGLRAHHRRFAIGGLVIIISSIVFLNVIFPIFFESLIQKETALKKGWFMRRNWRRLPYAYEFKVYVFNVTNPNDIDQGEKPIVREIGPFVYDVWQQKTKLEDHETDDTLSYSVNNTYYFNKKKSKCLTDEDELTFSHFLMIGLPLALLQVKPTLIPIATKAVDVVMEKPKSVFVKARVKTILFDGYIINCKDMEEFFGKALCNELKETWSQYRFRKLEDNVYSLSLFGHLNGTDFYSGQSRIHRGINNIKEIGELVEHNYMTYLSIWQDDECDAIHGTDGTLFQPFLDKHKNLYVTYTFYCRSLLYRYESSVKFAGLKLYRYTTSLGTNLDTNPKDKCYCKSPDSCIKDGVYDVWKCFYTPLIISNPHFYLADRSYVQLVDGVNPVKKQHMMILDIDPLTGWPVRTHFRFQANYHLMKLPKYRLMQKFPEAFLPLVWVDQEIVLPNIFLDKIVHFHKIIWLARASVGLAILVGLMLGSFTVFHEYRLAKVRRTQKKIMKKYLSKWKQLTTRQNKKNMGISLRTIMTLKMIQRNQVAAATARDDTSNVQS